MTQNGERFPGGNLNNILSSIQMVFGVKNRYKGCGEQADKVTVGLQNPKVRYEDQWSFEVIWVNRGTHQIGRARSSNPNDPDVLYDPWNNAFMPAPHGWEPRGPLSDP
jgi:hypothetical protein